MKNPIIKYRYSIIALLMIVLSGVGARASAPWTVNPGDYRYDMSLYLDVSFAAGKMDYTQYDVAAFVGDQCRGIAEVLPLSNGTECLYLRARSNSEEGETLTFKYYDRTTDEVKPIDGVSVDFKSNACVGYPSSPYAIKIIRHYDVVLSAADGGSIDREGGRIAENTELVITATPAVGHHFTQWSDGNTDNPRTIVVDGDLTLEAEFAVNQYKLVYTVDGAPYKEYEVDYGAALTAEAEPVKEGHTFSGWEGLPETMPARDVTVTGSFSINSYNAVFKIDDTVIETKSVVFGEAVTAPEAPAKEGHTFAGWQNVPETMPARDIEVLGSYTVNQYKLVYTVDGAPYKEYEIDYGTALTAEAEPVKEGHTFSGWDGLPETMPARDVTVTGSFSINSYNAVFKIDDTVIETKSVVFGEAVTAPEAPAKEGHTFAGWQDVPETMPARDIEIIGSYTVNQYKLVYTVDGAPYKEYEVDFGTALTAEAEPVKEGHTFSGWEGLPETMPARDVTVTGSFSINSYNAVFKIDDTVIETKSVVFGEAVTAPEAPAKEGHTFAGWQNVPETMPARDIEVLGSYTVNQYKLVYTVDGAPYKEYEIDYGTALTAEAEPVKEGHTFSGWDGLPETMPARDVTVTGSFSINSYNAVFKIDDTVIETKSVVFGEAVTAPEAPAKEGHTFAGWQDVPETMPAHDIEIIGSYTVNKYTLTYVVDGETYKTVEVEFGAAIEPETPEKEGHTFSGWDALPETMPANNVTASGSFTINSYNVVFKIDDAVIETKSVVFGEAVTAPEAPAKEGHTFAGWQNVPETMPARDIEIIGSYTLNKYTLTYVVDGETYKTVEVEFGAAIEPETPEKEGHTFSGWDALPETMPANDVTVTGSFSINSYNVVFKIDGTVIETKSVVFGEAVTAPEAPAKEGHTFAGWQDVPETMPARDIEIIGSYTVNKYTLTYVVDGETYKTVEVEFGAAIEPETPEKEGHTFSGWDTLPETMPANDVTASGSFSINSYNAVFKIDGTVIETKSVVFGEAVTAPDAPAKEGHTFAGWQDVPETMPAHDIEIIGSYTVNKYTLTYVVDGETYKTVEVEFGAAIEPETPEKEGHTFSGWDALPETMPANDVTASGSFSINSYCLRIYLNDELYHSEMIEYGAEVKVDDPTVPEGMEFNGWTDEIPETMPAHDVDIHGTYSKISGVDLIRIDGDVRVTVCTVNGHILHNNRRWDEVKQHLSEGLYIINGVKYLIR